MDNIKLFEIPIYSMEKEKFDKKWNDFFEKSANREFIKDKKEHIDFLKRAYKYQNIWEYNQIIGYLVITFKNNTIWFEEYATLDRKIYAISTTKHFISDLNLIGYHFPINRDMKNDEIKTELKEWVNSFEKHVMQKKYFLDKKAFSLWADYFDFRKMISEINIIN